MEDIIFKRYYNDKPPRIISLEEIMQEGLAIPNESCIGQALSIRNKDINDDDIYTGDILADGKTMGQVYYDRGRGAYMVKGSPNDNAPCSAHECFHSYTIVGNIYQDNPPGNQ